MTQRPFRFGVVAPQARSAAEWREVARRAETFGYASLLLPDTTGPILAPFAALGVAAGCTTALHLGNWVLANDFRNPVLVGSPAAMIEQLEERARDLRAVAPVIGGPLHHELEIRIKPQARTRGLPRLRAPGTTAAASQP